MPRVWLSEVKQYLCFLACNVHVQPVVLLSFIAEHDILLVIIGMIILIGFTVSWVKNWTRYELALSALELNYSSLQGLSFAAL